MIRGHLTFENPDAVEPGQDVTITLQDTSRLGDRSVDVAKVVATIPDNFDASSETLPFEIDVPHVAPAATIKAHLAKHGGPDIQLGDMITTQSIPADSGDDITVPLQLVD
ncbi:hypothetical protein [uncultured Litoreibacter sp.]|uniref:hypothetical protein n=1 Tax=uncultured Litoreibacter sp. TaxID=1392394 RepID=UPI00261630E4|nr:hypothetical protein [uncultured Litoreibacter sp.]